MAVRVMIHHVLAEGWGIEPRFLEDRPLALRFLEDARRACGLSFVADPSAWSYRHPSDPSHDGVSGLALMADMPSAVAHCKESHIALHAWPAHGFLAVDVASCHPVDEVAIRRLLEELYGPRHLYMMTLHRGYRGREGQRPPRNS